MPETINSKQIFLDTLRKHQEVVARCEELADDVAKAAEIMIQCVKNGGTIFWCGNGGSASDAQHMAAELVGRFERERRAISSIALTLNSSSVTAIANDYGFEHIFSRQLEAYGKAGDVLIAISTSGNSENVVRAVRKARELGINSIGLLGRNGGGLLPLCQLSLIILDDNTARIQELHSLVGHILCDVLEKASLEC